MTDVYLLVQKPQHPLLPCVRMQREGHKKETFPVMASSGGDYGLWLLVWRKYWRVGEELFLQKLNKTNIVIENCTLLDHYTASSGKLLPTFRVNLWFPYSGSWDGQVVPKRRLEITTTSCVIIQKSAVFS